MPIGWFATKLRCQFMTMASGSQTSKTCRICDKDLDPGGGSYTGLYEEAPPERGAFVSSQYIKG